MTALLRLARRHRVSHLTIPSPSTRLAATHTLSARPRTDRKIELLPRARRVGSPTPHSSQLEWAGMGPQNRAMRLSSASHPSRPHSTRFQRFATRTHLVSSSLIMSVPLCLAFAALAACAASLPISVFALVATAAAALQLVALHTTQVRRPLSGRHH